MHQTRAMCACRQRHLLGAERVNGIEALPATLEQDADQVDQHMGVARRRFHRWRVAQIGLYGVDLADAAKRLQMIGKLGPAHRHADAVALPGKQAHQMAAEEAGATIDGDEGFAVTAGGHLALERVMAQPAGREIQDRPGAVQRRQIPNGPAKSASIDKPEAHPYLIPEAQVAELVDALVSGTSGESRGGSSPLLGTSFLSRMIPKGGSWFSDKIMPDQSG